ncbi:MAG: signal peptidase I [Epulopiscium sp.]|nr:signal peptidase I [Candidatus Epulonipiscium sp.]
MEIEKSKKGIQYVSKIIFIIAFVLVFRTFIFGTIGVKGSSMEPTLYHGDVVAINKLGYLVDAPEFGDIVICNIDSGNGQERIIKRVIGLPGDEVELREIKEQYELEYELYINGEKIEEPYLKEIMQQPGDQSYPLVVPEGAYFVMGDNRNASTDSRTKAVGVIPKKDVEGKAFLRIYPLNSFGKLN